DALGRCPIYLLEDASQFDLPALSPRIINCIPRIEESAKFQRMLRKLDHRRREEWARAKAALAIQVPGHPKFEKLQGSLAGLFSIRLGNGFRAHLRPADNGVWEAVEVGSHTAMRHG